MQNMKQIFLYLFMLFSISLSAQRKLPQYNTAAGTLTQTDAGTNYVDIRIDYSDQTGMTDGSTINNQCVLLYFNTDDNTGYELPVTSVITSDPINPVIRVNITGFPALNGAINGQGVIYKKNSTTHIAPYVANAVSTLQQVIQEAMVRDIETSLITATDVTKYTGSGVPSFSPTASEPKLAQGLSSPYPFYAYNGTSWVAVGSGSLDTTLYKVMTRTNADALYLSKTDKLDSSKLKASGIAAWNLSQQAIDSLKLLSNITVNNGLTKTGINIQLGGILTHGTAINGNQVNDFIINDTRLLEIGSRVGTNYASYYADAQNKYAQLGVFNTANNVQGSEITSHLDSITLHQGSGASQTHLILTNQHLKLRGIDFSGSNAGDSVLTYDKNTQRVKAIDSKIFLQKEIPKTSLLSWHNAESAQKDSSNTQITYTRIGDSKTERIYWQDEIRKRITQFGYNGIGYISANQTVCPYSDIDPFVYNYSPNATWQTVIDSNSIDGYAISGVGGDSLFIAQNHPTPTMFHTRLIVFYLKKSTGGSIKWNVSSSNNTNLLQYGNVSTLGIDNTLGMLIIDNIPNPVVGEQIRENIQVTSGSVKILGFYAYNPLLKGIIINKIGHGGWNTGDFNNIFNNPTSQEILKKIHYNGLIDISLGANDVVSYNQEVFYSKMKTLVNQINSQVNQNILLTAQADMNGRSQDSTEKTLLKISKEFFNTDFYSERVIHNNQYQSEYYIDGVHENIKGYRLNAEGKVNFLKSAYEKYNYEQIDFRSDTALGYGVKMIITNNTTGNRQLSIADSETGIGLKLVGNRLNGYNYKSTQDEDITIGAMTKQTNLIGLNINLSANNNANQLFLRQNGGVNINNNSELATQKLYVNGDTYSSNFNIGADGYFRVSGGNGNMYFDNFSTGGKGILIRTNSVTATFNDLNNTFELFGNLYVSQSSRFNNSVVITPPIGTSALELNNLIEGAVTDSVATLGTNGVVRRLSISQINSLDNFKERQNSTLGQQTITLTNSQIFNGIEYVIINNGVEIDPASITILNNTTITLSSPLASGWIKITKIK
jgi:hypothetical protein